MENNIKAFRVHRALFWFYSITSLLFISILCIATFVWKNSTVAIPIELYHLLAISVFASLVHFVVGKGAKKNVLWGRNASFIVAVIMLFALPIGPIIGIYLLFNLRNWNLSSKTIENQIHLT